jgi:hypothetical protein
MAIRQPAAERRIHAAENPAFRPKRNDWIYFGIKVRLRRTCISPPLRVEHYAHAGE